jgi:hypothetical protein
MKKNIIAKHEKENFNQEVKKWRVKIKKGKTNENEFLDWINSTYHKKGAFKNGNH